MQRDSWLIRTSTRRRSGSIRAVPSSHSTRSAKAPRRRRTTPRRATRRTRPEITSTWKSPSRTLLLLARRSFRARSVPFPLHNRLFSQHPGAPDRLSCLFFCAEHLVDHQFLVWCLGLVSYSCTHLDRRRDYRRHGAAQVGAGLVFADFEPRKRDHAADLSFPF